MFAFQSVMAVSWFYIKAKFHSIQTMYVYVYEANFLHIDIQSCFLTPVIFAHMLLIRSASSMYSPHAIFQFNAGFYSLLNLQCLKKFPTRAGQKINHCCMHAFSLVIYLKNHKQKSGKLVIHPCVFVLC